MKKIVFFIKDFNHDGISNQIEILAKSLIDLYKIEIVCLNNNKDIKNKKLEITEINVDENIFSKLAPSLVIRKSIDNICGDIFIITDPLFINYVSKKEFSDTNIIYWMHSLDLDKRILNKIFDYDNIVVPSIFIKEELNSRKVIVIPNAISLSNKLKKYNNTMKLLTVCKLTQDKSVSELIRVVKEIVSKGYNVSFNIIGDGPERNNIMKLIKTENLGNNINMLGFYNHDDINQELLDADIFLFASNTETFGISVLEAMSVGLPVVSFDDRAIRELINDDIDGFIIENRSYIDMADKVISLLEDVNIQENIGSCAIEKSINYDINVIKREWLKILK